MFGVSINFSSLKGAASAEGYWGQFIFPPQTLVTMFPVRGVKPCGSGCPAMAGVPPVLQIPQGSLMGRICTFQPKYACTAHILCPQSLAVSMGTEPPARRGCTHVQRCTAVTNVHAYVITCWCPAPHVMLLPAWGTAQLRGHVHVCVCVCAWDALFYTSKCYRIIIRNNK